MEEIIIFNMPGISHLVTGMIFATLIYNSNPKKYTKKMAIIFAFMCYMGPDFAHFITFSDFDHRLGHSILGWPIYCVWMIPIFVFLTRFRFNFRKWNFIDEGFDSAQKLSWWRVYLLMIAGGIFHFSVDITFESKRLWSFPLDNPIFLHITNFTDDLETFSILNSVPSWVNDIASIMIILMLYLFIKGLRKSEENNSRKSLNIYILLFVVFYIVFFLLVGIRGEEDLGAILYFTIFFFLPFTLNLIVFLPENYQPKISNYDKTKGELKIKISIIWLIFCALLLISLVIGAYTFLYDLVGTVDFLINNLLWLSLVVLFLASLFIISSILLSKKRKFGYNLTKFLLIITSIIMIPLVIWGLLSETEVLEQFNSDKHE